MFEYSWQTFDQCVVLDLDIYAFRFLFQGLETDSPVLQLDEYIFAGEYEDAVGTYVLLEEKSNSEGKYFGSLILSIELLFFPDSILSMYCHFFFN